MFCYVTQHFARNIAISTVVQVQGVRSPQFSLRNNIQKSFGPGVVEEKILVRLVHV